MSKKIKVNFTMPAETKEFLDEINDATIPHKPSSRSEIVEKILNFDDDAAKIFFEIYKYKNNKKIQQQQFLNLDDGGFIFSKDLMEEIIRKFELEKINQYSKIITPAETKTENTIEQRLTACEKALVIIKGNSRYLENKVEDKVEKLSDFITQKFDEIAEMASELQETRTSSLETSAKLALISDEELLNAIAEIVFKKLKENN